MTLPEDTLGAASCGEHGFRIDMWERRTDRRFESVYLFEWADAAARDTAWKGVHHRTDYSPASRRPA